MKRKGLRFVRAYKVVTLPNDLTRMLNDHHPPPGFKGFYSTRFGQIINHKHWQPKQKTPKGAILTMLNVPLSWVHDEESVDVMALQGHGMVRIPWAVKVIPCAALGHPNVMLGPKRVFWAEGGKCYSTSFPMTPKDLVNIKADRALIPAVIHEWQNKQRLDAQVGGAISYKPTTTVRMQSPQGMTVQFRIPKNR